MKQIGRDPFARVTFYRRSVTWHSTNKIHPRSCAWCGNPGKALKNSLMRLFQYGYECDGLYTSVHWDNELFCCKDCHDTYYEGGV